MTLNINPQDIIDELNMQPHPEGGFFAEVYRASDSVCSPFHDKTRATVTHIYFLLMAGQKSRFHEVQHDEIWNYYCGAPLNLYHIENTKALQAGDIHPTRTVTIGTVPHFTHVIPASQWQAAESQGEFTLVGCSVAPGFDFEDFRFMERNEQKWVEENRPDWMRFV